MATVQSTSLNAVTATGVGDVHDSESTTYRQHTVIASATGVVTAVTILIEISHDQTNWAQIASIALTGAEVKQASFTAAVRFVRANLTVLTADPGAAVTATISSG